MPYKHLHLKSLIALLVLILSAASCSENTTTWDPYANWQERNAEWFRQVSDTARMAIAQAQAQYGEQWEQHCAWRRFKTLQKNADVQKGQLTDTICVKIVKQGEHAGQENYKAMANDTVRLCFRGWLMPTQYEDASGALVKEQKVFSQTYYGDFNVTTAASILMAMSNLVEGFATALQQMTPGDDWLIYLPEQMAYGGKQSGTIPPYSTLLYRIYVCDVYRSGSGVPDVQ